VRSGAQGIQLIFLERIACVFRLLPLNSRTEAKQGGETIVTAGPKTGFQLENCNG
jgi:hypothetical protein